MTCARPASTLRSPVSRYISVTCPSTFSLRLLAISRMLSPFFVAFPYVSPVSALSSAFTHFDRGGRGFTRLSPFNNRRLLPSHQSRVTSHKSRVFKKLPPLCPLFAAFSPLVSFLFSNLQTLFCRPGGWHPLVVARLTAGGPKIPFFGGCTEWWARVRALLRRPAAWARERRPPRRLDTRTICR
jgi:hypothetical protein